MKKFLILFCFATLLPLQGIFADYPFDTWVRKVTLTMKNGSQKTGFIVWNLDPNKQKFDIDYFLKFYLKKTNNMTSFDLYANIYHVNDDGVLNGFVLRNDEKQSIEANQVLKITALPNPYNNQNFDYPVDLSKSDIDLLQKKLLFTDFVDDPDSAECELYVLNFDSRFNKEEIHKILLKYCKICSDAYRNKDKNFNPKELIKKMGWEKIYFFNKCTD